MVWARTKLLIWDYLFEPVKTLKINYIGPTPEKYYKKLHELMRSVFNVPDGYIQEKDYTWEKAEAGEKFKISWEMNKILDTFTYMMVEIEMEGFTSKGNGKVKLKLRPVLITEYPQDTVWQNSIIYEMFRRLWHKAFYHKKRMQFLYSGKESLVTFERELKSFGEQMKGGPPDV